LSERNGQRAELVLFDAGGVLLLPDAARIIEALDRFGFKSDPVTVDRAHYAAMAAVDRALQGRRVGPGGLTSADWDDSLRDAYRRTKKQYLGLPADCPPELEQAIFEARWARVAPGAIETLTVVANRNIPIGIVSNSDGTIEADLKAFKICQVGPGGGTCVVKVVDSSVVGVAKPDPAIFDFALEAAGVPANHSVFVGDSVAIDVAGAAAAGISAIHLDPYDFCEGTDHRDVRALIELASLVGDQP
jgi:putative hydrolase of the HAD superfamily